MNNSSDGSAEPVFQDLSKFRNSPGFRGRAGIVVLIWQTVQATLFAFSPQPLYGWRRFLLRLFGAKVGEGVIIRPSARITYPWKVTLGAHCWLGDHAELYSLGPIAVGESAVISQRSYLCTGSHDLGDVSFPLTAAPILIGDQVWIATDCYVAPGVTIGRGAVIAARSTVLKDIPAGAIAVGAPATVRKWRVAPSSVS